MTFWPTSADIQVWTTPRSEVVAATVSMPPTSQSRSVTSWPGSASSMTARTRNGWAIEMAEVATMIAVTMASARRCGPKSASTRLISTGLSASWARSAGSTRAAPRPPRSPEPVWVVMPSSMRHLHV
jgi:hypothetical protein